MAIDSILRAVVNGPIADFVVDSMGNIDLGKIAKDQVDSQIKEMGKVNIIVAGKTGAGKSTLINAVLEGNLAETGIGKPITQHIKKHTKEGVPVGIIDTKGLEVKDYKTILDELSTFVKTTNANQDPSEHVHVAWICIAEGSRRVEEAEVLLAKQLAEHMPVIVVITTATSDNGFRDVVKGEFPFAVNVVRVNSLPASLDGEDGDDGLVVPVKGLKALVDLTIEVIPEGRRRAFAAAQKISLDLKISQAHKIVAASALTAGGIGAAPIPFSDAIGIVPVQIAMLAGISTAFGLKLDQAFLSSLVAGTFTATAGSMAGKALVGSLLKMFPGIGSVAGGAISGTIAATLTTTFGETYIAVLSALLKDSPDRELSAEEVTKAFKEKLG